MTALWRPHDAFKELAAHPRLSLGAAMVAVSGAVSAGLEIAAAALSGDARTGLGLSLLLPLLFVAFWGIAGWLIDAAAVALGRSGRRRTYLAVSGAAFPALVAFAALSLVEAAATRLTGSDALASGLAWLTILVLGWYLVLATVAVRAVYDVPLLNAAAMAMLPYAAVTGALLIVLVVLLALRAAGAI